MLLRRSRGHAPGALRLAPGFEQAPPVLAMGAELKNTLCHVVSGAGRKQVKVVETEKAVHLITVGGQSGRYKCPVCEKSVVTRRGKAPRTGA